MMGNPTLILTSLCLHAVLLTGVQWDVHQSNGTIVSGELLGLGENVATVDLDEGTTEIPISEIMRIVAPSTGRLEQKPDFGKISIRLRDQSLIRATSFRWTGDLAQATLAAESPSQQVSLPEGREQVPTKRELDGGDALAAVPDESPLTVRGTIIQLRPTQILSVRLRSADPVRDEQWSDIVAITHRGDVLVIRKGETTLDFLEGVIRQVGERSIRFEFDGELIEVPLTKIEGFIFHGPTVDKDLDPRVRVRMWDGAVWNAAQMNVRRDIISFTSVGGVQATLPLSAVASIDLAATHIAYLSDWEPTGIKLTPTFPSALQPSLNRLFYAPKRDLGFDGSRLRLRYANTNKTQFFDKGLALHSRTEISYRLAGRYRTLKAMIGMDPDTMSSSSARLIITADDETIFDRMLRGSEDPLSLEANVANRRELTIVVDYGDELDVGDRVNLGDIRVIK